MSDLKTLEATQEPTKGNRRTQNLNKNALMAVTVILLLALIFSLYFLNHREILRVNARISDLSKRLDAEIENSTDKANTAASQNIKETSATQDIAQNAQSFQDSSFVAIAPNSGMGAPSNKVIVFSWTPHKLAEYYVVEFRLYGQQDYPNSRPENKKVEGKDAEAISGIVSTPITFNSSTFVNYQWRISARKMVNGKEVVLQNTDSNWNLSIGM